MPFLAYLRRCSYWLFLLYATGFLTATLVTMHSQDTVATTMHPFLQYGTIFSMLLTISLSVTLWVARPHEDENGSHSASKTTILLTLCASLLVAGMIAALLFFL